MPDKLAEQRDMIFELLKKQLDFYNRPEAVQAQQLLTDRAQGGSVPFGPNVVNAMFADNADAQAAQVAGDAELINRAFANAGLSGSGLQTSAILNSRSRAAGRSRAGRRDITSRAELANFQAKERAQQQLVAFLAQKQAAEQAVAFREADLRSQIHATGDPQNVAQVTGTPPEQVAQAQNPGGAPAPLAQQAAPAPINRRARHGTTPIVTGNFVNLPGGGGVGPMNANELRFVQSQNLNRNLALNRFEQQRQMQQATNPFSRALGGFF